MHGDSLVKILVGWFLLVGWNAAIATKAKEYNDNVKSNGEEGLQEDSNKGDETRILLGFTSDDDTDSCITSADCAFNGECSKNRKLHVDSSRNKNSSLVENIEIDPEAPGFCDCFAGWKGNTCEVLDLLPVNPQRVGLVLPNRDSSTWGGSVVYHEADGLYHMFASEILYNCGLYSWTTNSQVRTRGMFVFLRIVYYGHAVCFVLCISRDRSRYDTNRNSVAILERIRNHLIPLDFFLLQVIRAVSESPFGPYRKVQVILPPFAHDANIIQAPTGEFVLFVTALEGVKPIDCRQTSNSNQTMRASSIKRTLFRRESLKEISEDNVPPKDTYMLWAPNPEGPWSEPVMVLNSTIYNSDYWKKHNKTAKCDSNLNGIILPSSSNNDNNNNNTAKQPFLGLWRRCETEELLTIPHVLLASDWKNASTYQPIIDHPLFVLAGSGAEDPSNIWTTKTSDMSPHQVAYHAIFHDEQATRCMLGSCGGQGRHAVSLDGTTWRYANVNAYERHFSWESSLGSAVANDRTTRRTKLPNKNANTMQTKGTVRADTRARPHIVLAKRGSHPLQQTPIALSTGLKETDESGYVYTLVQPLRSSNDATVGLQNPQ